MSIGKLALETLLSGKPELERSKIVEQVGEEVFEYGLLIGEDGFSLTRDMTVDILVTFPHRSLQEFLGAFYFVLSLGKRQAVNDVDKVIREYLKNPLFSKFCLWLLDGSNEFFSFLERSTAFETLINYVSEQIDAFEVDFEEHEKHNNPALSLALGDNRNEMALKILEGSLMTCSRIKHIVIEPHHPIDRILGSIPPLIFQRLKSIKISNFQEIEERFKIMPYESPLHFLHNHSFNLPVKCDVSTRQSVDALNAVLKVCNGWNRSVYLRIGRSMHGLLSQGNTLTNEQNIPMEKTHQHFLNEFLIDCDLKSRDVSYSSDSRAWERLRKLPILDISENEDVSGKLSMLLSQCFPSLHTLILSNCRLQISDVQSLAKARKESRLPQLRHLDISFNFHPDSCGVLHSNQCLLPILFQQGMPTLNTLVVRGCWLESNDLSTLHSQAMKNHKLLSELKTLDMSHNQAIGGSLSALIRHYFPHLEILVLRCCGLNSDDLIHMGEANSYGRIPKLRYLDLSQNDIGGKKRGLLQLFGGLNCFPSLSNFIVCFCHLELQDLCCLTQAKLDGKLPRIRHLDISFNGLSGHVGILSRDPVTQREISWGNVICNERQLIGR